MSYEEDGQESTRHEMICEKKFDGMNGISNTETCCKRLKKDKGEEASHDIKVSNDVRESIRRDFEFLKSVTDLESEVLYSLLLPQIDNSGELETIMGDILGVPIDSEDTDYLGENWKDPKIRGLSAKFLIHIREMFPDVDLSFLAHECRSLITEEDCTRFVNTVMLSGVYQKKTSTKDTPREMDNGGDTINELSAKPVNTTNEENSSAIVDSGSNEIKRNEKIAEGSDGETSNSDGKFIVVDLTNESDGAESDLPKTDEVDVAKIIENAIKKINDIVDDKSNEFQILDKSDEASLSGSKTETLELENTGANAAAKVNDDRLNREIMSDSDYWIAERTAELISLFPDTDPSFLRSECVKFQGSARAMSEFVLSKFEKNDMPSIADYQKRKEIEELQSKYTYNFSIEDFLRVIPDPWTYFSNNNRKCVEYEKHSFRFLKATFSDVAEDDIHNLLTRNMFNLYMSYKELMMTSSNDTEIGTWNPIETTEINIKFLQEVAFIQNEEKIRNFIRIKEIVKKLRFEEAKRNGNLLECQCCYDSEVMVEDLVYCPNDHAFCKPCLIKYIEVEMGQAKCQFPCLAGCGQNYTLFSIQSVLKPEMFSKVIQANQMEEIKAAGIENLVQCPFCNYATIMPPEMKILACLNPECQKESCRLCKELSHVPLRCYEVEKPEEVKMRTYIENRMTEALIRTCYKCGKSFVKEEGCNKMVCRCGAKMCYVCRKPVTSYSHFNGQGGTDYEKCPLYSTNDELHVDFVQRVAEEAKAEILKANPNKTLKHDPTVILPKRTYDPPVVGMLGGLAARQIPIARGGQDHRAPVRNNNIGARHQGVNRPR